MVGGSCSVCRSDLSTIVALEQGLQCALARRCFRSVVFPVASCSFRVRGNDLRPRRTYKCTEPFPRIGPQVNPFPYTCLNTRVYVSASHGARPRYE